MFPNLSGKEKFFRIVLFFLVYSFFVVGTYYLLSLVFELF
jgi:hypothetical protein